LNHERYINGVQAAALRAAADAQRSRTQGHMVDRKEHWERVYGAKPATQVSWYAARLVRSIAMIQGVATTSARIIDVGGGASTLVDDLVASGYSNVSVLDVSASALAFAKERLGSKAEKVEWIIGDVLGASFPLGAYDVWHDRAVFHFLTSPADRRSYLELAARSVKPGGYAVIATFSLEGPARCSGLDVTRYSAESLRKECGPAFVLRQDKSETHRTPSGAAQAFLYCLFERVSSAG